MRDIVEELRVDFGRKTIGELVREREAAALEIERLRTAGAQRNTRASGQSIESLPRPLHDKTLLRMADVCAAVGLSRSSVYAKVAEGSFPRPVKIAQRAVRWRASDVVAWLARCQIASET